MRLMCSRCTLGFEDYAIQKLGLTYRGPCPDRLTCTEDGPDPDAILLRTLEECDEWEATAKGLDMTR